MFAKSFVVVALVAAACVALLPPAAAQGAPYQDVSLETFAGGPVLDAVPHYSSRSRPSSKYDYTYSVVDLSDVAVPGDSQRGVRGRGAPSPTPGSRYDYTYSVVDLSDAAVPSDLRRGACGRGAASPAPGSRGGAGPVANY